MSQLRRRFGLSFKSSFCSHIYSVHHSAAPSVAIVVCPSRSVWNFAIVSCTAQRMDPVFPFNSEGWMEGCCYLLHILDIPKHYVFFSRYGYLRNTNIFAIRIRYLRDMDTFVMWIPLVIRTYFILHYVKLDYMDTFMIYGYLCGVHPGRYGWIREGGGTCIIPLWYRYLWYYFIIILLQHTYSQLLESNTVILYWWYEKRSLPSSRVDTHGYPPRRKYEGSSQGPAVVW